MGVKSFFRLSFYKLNLKDYYKAIQSDEYALSTFRNGTGKLSRRDKKCIEYKAVKWYRLHDANYDTIWRYLFAIPCHKYYKKYGIEIYANRNIGKGMVIGHWGRIVVSGEAMIGDQLMITHNVTIGRDIRGKHKGVPTIGNRVAIRTNSTVVGKIVIGDDVLIAPNTFVNFDVPSHSIVIGNPAKIISRKNASDGHIGRLPE